MQLALKDVAEIRAGYPFRGSVEAVANGSYRVVQIRDVMRDVDLDVSNLIRTNLPEVRSDFLLQSGNVLLIARGNRRDAITVPAFQQDTIAGYQFFVIQPDHRLMPEYLAWYLNQEPAQAYLVMHAKGTNVQVVTKETLSNLPLEVPPLGTQENVVRIHHLHVRETTLLRTLEQKRSQLIERTLLKAIQTVS